MNYLASEKVCGQNQIGIVLIRGLRFDFGKIQRADLLFLLSEDNVKAVGRGRRVEIKVI